MPMMAVNDAKSGDLASPLTSRSLRVPHSIHATDNKACHRANGWSASAASSLRLARENDSATHHACKSPPARIPFPNPSAPVPLHSPGAKKNVSRKKIVWRSRELSRRGVYATFTKVDDEVWRRRQRDSRLKRGLRTHRGASICRAAGAAGPHGGIASS